MMIFCYTTAKNPKVQSMQKTFKIKNLQNFKNHISSRAIKTELKAHMST